MVDICTDVMYYNTRSREQTKSLKPAKIYGDDALRRNTRSHTEHEG